MEGVFKHSPAIIVRFATRRMFMFATGKLLGDGE